MKHSIPDEIYHDIFGEYPKKSGAAYERLSSIALTIVKEQKGYVDQHIRGTYSDTSYQLDGKLESDIETSMIEAKDYTIENKKVGRGDLQKLGGALPDLKEIDKGVFASATKYTKLAIKYAKAAKDITGKPIELFEIREATSEDEKGRIKTIKLEIYVYNLTFERGKYQPCFSKAAIDQLANDGILGKPVQLRYQ